MSEPQFVGIAPCWGCRKSFAFDVDRVISISIDPVTNLPPDLGGDPARARKVPVCVDCVRSANALRAEQGLPLWDETDYSIGSQKKSEHVNERDQEPS